MGEDWIGLDWIAWGFVVGREGARLTGASRRGSQPRAETVDGMVGVEWGTEGWTMLGGR